MTYLSSFKFDIFISYAHVDNLSAVAGSQGWITQFQQYLQIQLWKRAGRMESVKIWWDPALDGNQLFDEAIQDRIDGSALFLALTSTGYLASDYCRQELRYFYEKAQREQYGLVVGDRLRIFNVLLNNIPPVKWPKEYGRSGGYPFHDAEREDDFGEPIELGERVFRQQLRSLVDSIYRTLCSIQEAQPSSKMKDPISDKGASCTVYVADTADSLKTLKKRVINELLQRGTRIATNVPPPFEPNAHEQRVTDELKKADLSLHLFDQLSGREIEGLPGTCYPQAQAELGIAHSRSTLIWVPRTLEPDSIDDDGYKQFLIKTENGSREDRDYDFIRGSPATIAGEVLEKIAGLKARSRLLDDLPMAALLDTHLKDQLHAFELSRFLLQRFVQPYINPEEDDPRKNLKLFEERLKQVSLLIVFFGDVSVEWVRARLAAALQIVIAQGCPLKACGVYLAPPHKSNPEILLEQKLIPIELMDNSEGFDPATVTPLLNRVKPDEVGEGR